MIGLREMGTGLRAVAHALALSASMPRHLAPDLEPIIELGHPMEAVTPQPRARRTAESALPLADPFGQKPSGMPVKGRRSSAYGMRFHPIKKKWIPHNGEDIAAPEGTAVAATAAGTVRFAGVMSGYGNVVEIDHGGDYATRYAHLQAIGVMRGQRVRRGEIIATVGMTGLATGPHLHYEVLLKGAYQDPRPFLAVG